MGHAASLRFLSPLIEPDMLSYSDRLGDVIVIRYADDTIVGFQHEHEAKAFLHDLQERMREFELALHPAKTRLIRFGRHAAKQREERGEGKPETFDSRTRPQAFALGRLRANDCS